VEAGNLGLVVALGDALHRQTLAVFECLRGESCIRGPTPSRAFTSPRVWQAGRRCLPGVRLALREGLGDC
jgi:hypothetical protein